MTGVILYSAFLDPYHLAFLPAGACVSTGLATVNILVDISYILDIAVACSTAFVSTATGEFVPTRWAIFRHYCRGWFVFDLVAALPVDIVVSLTIGFGRRSPLAGLSMLKCVKLARVGKLVKACRQLRSFFTTHVFTIAWLYVCFALSAHWCACLLYHVSSSADGGGWVHIMQEELGIATSTAAPAETLAGDAHESSYTMTLYAAFLLLIGENIGWMQSDSERWLVLVFMAFGTGLSAVLFGQIGLVICNMNKHSTRYEHLMERVHDHCKHLHLPQYLHRRVLTYYKYLWNQNRCLDREEFVGGLSQALQTEVLYSIHAEMISRVPMFHGLPSDAMIMLAQQLQANIYLPGDIVIREGGTAYQVGSL
jgi:hypothetical protein